MGIISSTFVNGIRAIRELEAECEKYTEYFANNKLELDDDIRKILTGDLQPKWKPKHGEIYYVPNIDTASCRAETWTNTSLDLMRQRKGIVFKTIAEATTCATRMLEAVGDIDG